MKSDSPMTLDDLRTRKRTAILAIAASHGVTAVRVFGSFSRAALHPLIRAQVLREAVVL
jgi:predicted nucleotidyltransferase